MNTKQTQYLSQTKLDSLKAELTELTKIKIPALANRIDEARQLGDLSENAEYHAAREDMAWVRSRVKEIEYILDSAEIISDSNNDRHGIVSIGSKIQVEINGNKRDYFIVGQQEAEPSVGKISNESPLGMAFIGKKAGDQVEIEVPVGLQVYKIISVN